MQDPACFLQYWYNEISISVFSMMRNPDISSGVIWYEYLGISIIIGSGIGRNWLILVSVLISGYVSIFCMGIGRNFGYAVYFASLFIDNTYISSSHPLKNHRLYLVNFKFNIYLPGLGWSPLSSATPSYTLPPKNHQADYPPATYCPYMVNFKLHLYFPGVGGVGNNQT